MICVLPLPIVAEMAVRIGFVLPFAVREKDAIDHVALTRQEVKNASSVASYARAPSGVVTPEGVIVLSGEMAPLFWFGS